MEPRGRIQGGFFNTVCFLAQQSAEKALKSVLYFVGTSRARLMTHSTVQFLQEAASVITSEDALQAHLFEHQVGTWLHYPLPLHLQEAYRSLGYARGDFPVAEKASESLLSLPMYPGLQKDQQIRVIEVLKEGLMKCGFPQE